MKRSGSTMGNLDIMKLISPRSAILRKKSVLLNKELVTDKNKNVGTDKNKNDPKSKFLDKN